MRIISLLLFAVLTAAAADQAEKTKVVAAVNQLFDAMSAGNGEAAAAAMLPDTKIMAVQDDKIAAARTRDEFAQRIGTSKNRLVERIWKPTVLIRGRIAVVWADYDLHAGGKFSHCGIDAFFLLKTDEGWKISSVEYTAETQGCKPSPLGPVTQ